MAGFNPSRLTLARKRLGWTKKALAEEVGLSARSITAYEAEAKEPSPLHLARIADVLGFPREFFSQPDVDELPVDGASFRALSRMTQKQRDQAIAAGELAFCLADWIETRFDLPQPTIPKLRGIDPEAAADVVRREWGLGEQPAGNMIHLLEFHGVRVFSLAEESREIDAFSVWRWGAQTGCDVPFVFLNTMKTTEHSRMDAAHELGHLVLHWRHETPQGREAENEANAFASAFLMPEASVRANAPWGGSRHQITVAKKRWGVSELALVYRMHKVRMLSDWQYRSMCIQISKDGGRTSERSGIGERETSQILPKVFRALKDDRLSKADVARELFLPPSELNKLIFGLDSHLTVV